MLAERKTRPQPVIMDIPPHKSSVQGTSGPHRSSGKDANLPATPQQQHNSSHHHSPYQQQQTYHHQVLVHTPSAQAPPSSQTQQKATTTTHPRRGSTDRGTKDPLKSRSSTPKAAPEHVGPYLVGKTLGKGSSGCVKLARHRKTNEQVAVKIISKASLANRAAVHRGIEREIAIMKLINHPHVIRLYDVYETDKELFLVMEYVSGGELFEYLVNKGRLDESEALRFFQQIIVGLAFCHKRKICHRDLKPENLLLDDRMNVKIADFGMASLQKTGRLLETSCGSPHYASPEVVTGMKYDGSSSDIWSCGIILYALLTGHLPFDDENIRQLLSKVKAGKFYMPTDISPGARDLISRMLTVNPKRRITMQGVMMHPWFRLVNPDRNTLGEPAEDPESGRPLLAEELDAEIIRHMRWLFAPGPSHSDPEAKEVFDEEALLLEIEEKMTNSEENMEKLFYHLLCQHKTELLENYTCDDYDSVRDGPRRRADSFPNSTPSMRSGTPDFLHSVRTSRDSPLSTPGSPLSPAVRAQVDPSPLSLNPALNDVAQKDVRSSSGRYARRASQESESHQSTSSTSTNSTNTNYVRPSGATKSGMAKEDSGRGSGVVKEDSTPYSPKLTTVSGSIHESLLDLKALRQKQPELPSIDLSAPHPTVVAPKPVSPVAQRSMLAVAATAKVLEEKQEDFAKDATHEITGTVAETTSIESEVLSTQISEAASASQEVVKDAIEEAKLSVQAPSSRAQSPAVGAELDPTDKEKSKSIGSKAQRPILHPLDVKASAGMTVMNVSVSQHSRKYSDGSPSVPTTTPLSPTGPKRPWFARLFDFKPQPLTFKSNWSAAETQERLEVILKDLFQTSIHLETSKRPNYGVKCRFDGGVMNDQVAKAVKFKIEISEKTSGYNLSSSPSTVSNVSQQSHNTISSSAVASILATVDHQQLPQRAHLGQQLLNNNHSHSHLPGVSAASSLAEGVAGRRASDGGSILSSAAAVMSTSLAAARNPFSHHHHHQQQSQQHHHHHYSGASTSGSSTSSANTFSSATTSPGYPPLHPLRHHQVHHHFTPPPLPRRAVKVTLHQQQGANSTLRMIHEKLCAVWEQQQFQYHQQQLQLQHQQQLQLQHQQQLQLQHQQQLQLQHQQQLQRHQQQVQQLQQLQQQQQQQQQIAASELALMASTTPSSVKAQRTAAI